MKNYVIVGGSRGIGAAATQHLVDAGHRVIAISRTPARAGTWVAADIATEAGLRCAVDAITAQLNQQGEETPLDGLLFLGGVWEAGAFTGDYDFLASPAQETRFLLAVNLAAPILLAQALVTPLSRAENPKIILNGSCTGLPNEASIEVANTATKFGQQGITEALNLALNALGISVTVVNFANVATPEVLDDIATGAFGKQVPIPLQDLLITYDYLLQLSADTVPQSLDLRQKYPDSQMR
ncbi:MAG: SDR family oxidoreductase [Pseudomonadota bacterium]